MARRRSVSSISWIDQGARTNRTFSPEETVAKFSEVVKQYGLSSVVGDRYAAHWPVVAFEKHGITYRPAELNRSQLYSALEPLLNSGQVELLDHPTLLTQLIGLVRKGEKIDHVNGEHDDWSNAASGALVLVQTAGAPFVFSCNGVRIGSGASLPEPLPVAIQLEPSRPNGKDLLAVSPIARKFLTDQELAERDELVAQAQRQDSPVERACRQTGHWWPRT
jgi:hypothetical protein